MSEWKKVRLGEAAVMKRGKYITRSDTRPGNIPVILGGQEPAYYCDEANHTGPCIVISRSGASAGFVSYWQQPIFVTDGFLFEAKERSSIHYLYYCIKANQSLLGNLQNATAIPHVRGEDLKDFEIPLPPLPTQRKIAAVLSSLDDKIENNRKICANLEAQAQAIFKSWFVDFEPFGGKMPQGWKMGKLGDVADITMGQSPDGKSLNDVGDGITFFQGRAEFGNRYPTKRLSTTEPKRMAKEGDVLLSVRAPVGDLNIALENCCIGRGLAAIRAKTECADQDVARPPRPCGKGEGALATSRRCQSFIYCLLRSMKPQFDLYEGAGTIFGSINKDSLHGLSCLVPDEKALQEFEGVVSSFDSLYRERELESRSLADLRDALLPKLMSGEIDVEKVKISA